jgi:hypothetical protein
VYGKRDGVLHGLAVISAGDKNHLMKQTPGWKQGVVHHVSMLARSQMFKPDTVLGPYFILSLFLSKPLQTTNSYLGMRNGNIKEIF